MTNGTCCAPMLFRKKSAGYEGKQLAETNKKLDMLKNPREVPVLKVHNSHSVAGNFITMAELRTKVLTFRDLIDLPPCVGSASANQLVIITLKDLHAMYPDTVPRNSMSENEGTPIHKALALFCNALKSVREMWMSKEEWLDKPKLITDDNIPDNEMEQQAFMILDDMIKMARERLFNLMDEDEPLKDYSSKSHAFGRALLEYPDNKTPSGSPATPTSVLPEMITRPYCSPLLLPLRIQAIEKLNPIDVKRLSFHMFPYVAATEQMNTAVEELKQAKAKKIDTEDMLLMTNVDKAISNTGRKWIGNRNMTPPSVHETLARRDMDVVLPPPSLPMLAMPPPPPPCMVSPNTPPTFPLPPPPPPPPSPPKLAPNATSGASAQPPMSLRNNVTPPPPPPPNGSVPPPPVPPGKGVAPPPPPALGGTKSLRPKKAATKLKRSSQMGNLYRLLKGKVEGSSLDGKLSHDKKNKIGAPAGGKQGMADALAEMTKRSAYYQQIGEDVKNYAKAITEVKVAINSFQTADMIELLKFHKYVESHLEKLTDESQVLARFEDFPVKKLEALRMAAALYSKLDTMVTTLQNWKIEPPLCQLLDKSESYVNKIKGDLDALERTKDEESKKFQSHKINFDFGILVRIKELIVDVSSGCMELALKIKREAKAKGNEKVDLKLKRRRKYLLKCFGGLSNLHFGSIRLPVDTMIVPTS